MTYTAKIIAKKGLAIFDLEPKEFYQRIASWSIASALPQNSFSGLVHTLKQIVPDISKQYSRENPEYNAYWELKTRAMHAFQCALMLEAVNDFYSNKLIVVDIGDSAGTHMLYLKELAKDRFPVETVSINLDHRAVDKIRSRGLSALVKRAEDIEPEDVGGEVDLFTSFEMIEHLHNPAIFLRRLARKTSCKRMLVTVPYVKQSRVGLHHIRNQMKDVIFAEDEHIFELNPEDWTLLFLHSGWRVISSRIYYQYPRRWPIVSTILKTFWKTIDFEGFWGALLIKDTTYSDFYKDWEDQ